VVGYVSQQMERLQFDGLDYLRAAAAQLEDVPVEPVVRFGEPVEGIFLEADACGTDLIAVATSRCSWLGRVLGSVGDKLLRTSHPAQGDGIV
jgi:nucleotide-binding universal stress UspA family protein